MALFLMGFVVGLLLGSVVMAVIFRRKRQAASAATASPAAKIGHDRGIEIFDD